MSKLLQEIENLKFNLKKKKFLKDPEKLLKKQQEIPNKLLKSVEEINSWIFSKKVRKKEERRKSEAQIRELIVDKKALNIKKKITNYLSKRVQKIPQKLTKRQKELAKDYIKSILKYNKK